MNPLLIDLNVIAVFLIFAQFSNSFNVYVIDTQGHIAELHEPIHIDEEHTPNYMRNRFARQLAEFLLSKKNHHKNVKKILNKTKDNIRSNSNATDLSYKISPVVFSDGRYILDLDKIDVKEEMDDSNRNENDDNYFDPAESFRDYYDYININNRLKSPVHLNDKTRTKRHHSLRKYSKKSNIGQDSSSSEYITILRDGKKTVLKRFKIVNNNSKMKKKKKEVEAYSDSDSDSYKSSAEAPKKKEKKKPLSSYETHDSTSSKEIDNSFSMETEKTSSEESPEEDEDDIYLQGNHLVQFKLDDNIDKTKRASLETLDGRRRLPHFLPKRYHWTPEEIKHLGYFWFNGPRGKYPEATPL